MEIEIKSRVTLSNGRTCIHRYVADMDRFTRARVTEEVSAHCTRRYGADVKVYAVNTISAVIL